MDLLLSRRRQRRNTVDLRLSPNRDVAAAKAFFRKAICTQGRAAVSITSDSSHRALREMPEEDKVWQHIGCGRRTT